MANKEALKELFELAVFDDNCDLDKCSKCSAALQKNCGPYQYYKTIERDLEILELLHKRIKPDIFGRICYVPIYEERDGVIQDFEAEKIWEWLRNDK